MLDLVQHAHRSGTQGLYESHWKSWSEWCEGHGVAPHSPSSVELSTYLGHLFKDRHLSPSSVRCHKSAVSTTIRQLGGPSFSDDPLLRDVIKGMSAEDAKSPKRFPAWDLFLVLASLRLPPYEPLRECPLKLLSEKTVFLVSLASGRRCSEVHALSHQDLAYEPDGSVSLRFLPVFLAKNQQDGTHAPPIFIKSLCAILGRDDEDRTLCPVRALRVYKKRTAPLRSPNKRRLFVSVREDMDKDISIATISRWLRNVIKRAYTSTGAGVASVDCRAHEIRAWAASLAWAHNTSLNSILDAAFWRNPGTFLEFYLRDVSRLNEDGSRGIASAVVAQQAISSASTSRIARP